MLIDSFVPVRRFQCMSNGCTWRGLVKSTRPNRPRSKVVVAVLTLAVLIGALVSVYMVTWIEHTYQMTKTRVD